MFITFLACLVASPTICEEKYIQIFEPISHHQCMMGAGFTLAQWTSDHYEWKVVKYTCEEG